MTTNCCPKFFPRVRQSKHQIAIVRSQWLQQERTGRAGIRFRLIKSKHCIGCFLGINKPVQLSLFQRLSLVRLEWSILSDAFRLIKFFSLAVESEQPILIVYYSSLYDLNLPSYHATVPAGTRKSMRIPGLILVFSPLLVHCLTQSDWIH